ncbi:MAG: o-succinylbenzoate synthase, partial [Proteobacteria bacterium]
MRIASLRIAPLRLPLVSPLATAHGAIAVRDGWLVAIEDDAGVRGWGEALPLPGFGLESAAQAELALARAGRSLRRQRALGLADALAIAAAETR